MSRDVFKNTCRLILNKVSVKQRKKKIEYEIYLWHAEGSIPL